MLSGHGSYDVNSPFLIFVLLQSSTLSIAPKACIIYIPTHTRELTRTYVYTHVYILTEGQKSNLCYASVNERHLFNIIHMKLCNSCNNYSVHSALHSYQFELQSTYEINLRCGWIFTVSFACEQGRWTKCKYYFILRIP